MVDSPSYEKLDLFYLGREVDPLTRETTRLPLLYRNRNFTTHGAIIGMTGSGKTGLGICLLEEAALDGVPAIVVDPKGDMGNLLLSFPELRAEDFLPWVDGAAAERKGISREELARETASTWEEGIASWDQDRGRIARMRATTDFTVYTPGAESGRPVSVLDSFDAPDSVVMEESDTVAGLVGSAVSSLLGLIGVKADPLQSREYILLSSIILHHWRQGSDLALESLIGAVVNPPLDRIGVFPLDTFYPQAKRMELAMQLNNILASPAFRGWISGDPLRIENLLYGPAGKPRISIFSIAHLGDQERMFFVTMLLGRLIAWMRRQEGSSGLRCLFYMDEIFGYFPPLGNPPSKQPMLLLLKQARAYGLGIVLATQNPVDLDYKGLSNIGTWFIGRLQTRQDQDRVLQGMAGSADQVTSKTTRSLLSDLPGRTFLMYSAHLDEPVLFETRWVMSYLKGPVSLAEVDKLPGMGGVAITEDDTAGLVEPSIHGEPPDSMPPPLPADIPQRFVLPPIPMENVTFAPALYGRARVRFYNQSRGIDQVRDVSRRLALDPVFARVDWAQSQDNPVTPDEITGEAPVGARFHKLPDELARMKNFRSIDKGFSDYLYHSMEIPLWRVVELKLESRPGESEEQFRQRVADCLREKKEDAVERLKERYQTRQKRLEQKLVKAGNRLEREKGDVRSSTMDTALSFGVAVLGALFGRKAMSVSTATRSARGMRSAGKVLREKEDVRRAEEDLARIEEEITLLSSELQEKIGEISERYRMEKYPLELFSIGPRRSDIFDVRTGIQWDPDLGGVLPE
ncbi:MAG: ATP-binding protein [Desulfobulbaceae bacterium]